jgi:DNA-binding PadR family transcriptional regulator
MLYADGQNPVMLNGHEPATLNGHVPAEPANCPHARFHLAPPRNFHYPAILLLLAEEPRHGYRLVDAMLLLGFGPVDRPSVYRALNDLEQDGLLSSWSAKPTAGSTRHVYALTPHGREVLAVWMHVIDEEQQALERMTIRYLALDDRAGPDLDVR